MPGTVHGFSPGFGAQPHLPITPAEGYREAAEQHPPRRHLEDQRVQPVNQQQLRIRRAAFDLDRRPLGNIGGGDDGRQPKRGLLERFGQRGSRAANAHVGLMVEVAPPRPGKVRAHLSEPVIHRVPLQRITFRPQTVVDAILRQGPGK